VPLEKVRPKGQIHVGEEKKGRCSASRKEGDLQKRRNLKEDCGGEDVLLLGPAADQEGRKGPEVRWEKWVITEKKKDLSFEKESEPFSRGSKRRGGRS